MNCHSIVTTKWQNYILVYCTVDLPVSSNYTVTAHDIVDGTIITNPSVVYPQENILLLPSPTETVVIISK